MKSPMINNHQIEKRLNKAGFNLIAGTDEVGRGCLAGPVCAAAVIMPINCQIKGVTDSKKISDKERRRLKEIIQKRALAYAIVFIDEQTIDKINILEASRLAMKTALERLSITPDYILTDAMFISTSIPIEAIIKGDEKSFSIGCASIIAKVARDDLMLKLDVKYPEYDFIHNKGYLTKKHIEAIDQFGILPIHRQTYAPIKSRMK